MQLPNVKELEKLLKMCRKQGITELSMQGMSFKFGDLPMIAKDGAMVAVEDDPTSPSDEDLAYWSAAPDPLAAREAGAQ